VMVVPLNLPGWGYRRTRWRSSLDPKSQPFHQPGCRTRRKWLVGCPRSERRP